MARYRIACIREQGVDFIVVPVGLNFGQKSEQQQRATITAMQASARTTGLNGTVVPIWRLGRQHKFVAPPAWTAFFRNLPWDLVLLRLNNELVCGE